MVTGARPARRSSTVRSSCPPPTAPPILGAAERTQNEQRIFISFPDRRFGHQGSPFAFLARSSFAAASRSPSDVDTQIFVEPEHLFGPQSREGQHLQDVCGDFLAELIHTRIGTRAMLLGDDIGDGSPTWAERLGESSEAATRG
jgi:hypothetical protein